MKITNLLNEKKDKLPFYGYCASAVILVIIIICLLFSLLTGKAFDQTQNGQKNSQGIAMPPDKLYDDAKYDNITVKVSAQVVEDELKNISKLITEEYYFTQVETYEKETTIGPLASKARIIYSYEGLVTAGIDCENITVSQDDDQKVLTVTIPKATIQYVDIDFDSFKLFEEKQGFWSKIKLGDVNKSLAEFKASATQSAKDKGILEKADQNAELILTQALMTIQTTNEYKVKFEHK